MEYKPPSLDDQNAILAALLVVLRALADGFAALYGAPGALAGGNPIYGDLRERALRWLHDMKTVARRLVFLRALQFQKPSFAADAVALSASNESGGARPKEQVKLPRSNDPALWRVHFSAGAPFDSKWLRSEAPQRRGYRQARKASLIDADDPRPLAEQFESVLRVIADVDYYAAQMAARMYRWRGRMLRLEKFLTAMCGAAVLFEDTGIEDPHWETIAAARVAASNMLPLYLRALESG